MFEIARETLLPCSPAQLWEVLANFDQYERWNPYVRPKGQCERGAEVEYAFRMNPANPRFWHVTATISEHEPAAHLAFDVKLSRLLLSIEEHFRIEQMPEGARLIHSICGKGLIARLRLSKARRNFKGILSEADRLLTQYLSRSQNKPVFSVKPKRRRRR